MPHTPEYQRERWEPTREHRTVLQQLQQDALAHLNYGSNVALSTRQAQLIEERTGLESRVTAQEIWDAFRRREWGNVLQRSFQWMFGRFQPTQGLGFYTRTVDHLPLRERMGIVTQLAQHLETEGEPRNLQDAVMRSAVQYETELSLLRRGYVADRTATRARSVQIEPGKHLSDYVTPQVMEQIRGTNGQEPAILGALTHDGALPAGSFLYLDAQGFPLLISRQLIPPGRFPPVPLFRRDPNTVMIPNLSRRDTAIEFLNRTLEPGDILLCSQGGRRIRADARVIQPILRFMESGRDGGAFHGYHAMTVQADGRIAHISRRSGRQIASVRDTFREHPWIATVTVARLRDASRIPQFVEQSATMTALNRRYNTSGFFTEGLRLLRQRIGLGGDESPDTSSTETGCLCVDYVTDAAQGAAPALAMARTAREVAQSPDVRLVYSMDFERQENGTTTT